MSRHSEKIAAMIMSGYYASQDFVDIDDAPYMLKAINNAISFDLEKEAENPDIFEMLKLLQDSKKDLLLTDITGDKVHIKEICSFYDSKWMFAININGQTKHFINLSNIVKIDIN